MATTSNSMLAVVLALACVGIAGSSAYAQGGTSIPDQPSARGLPSPGGQSARPEAAPVEPDKGGDGSNSAVGKENGAAPPVPGCPFHNRTLQLIV
jgi:hypothetical protein